MCRERAGVEAAQRRSYASWASPQDSTYSEVVRTALLYIAFACLLAFTAYTAYIAVGASIVIRGEGSDPEIFWPATGILFVLAVIGGWITRRVWARIRRERFPKPS